MRSAIIAIAFSLLGGFFVLIGTAFLLEPTSVYAQDDEVKEYYGVRECNDCHGRLSRSYRESPHGTTFMEISEDEEDQALILADFSLNEDLRTVQFPNEDSPRAFVAEDIAYTLGSGRNLQAYVYQAEDDSLMVFPAQWNIGENTWQALALGESWPDAAYDFVDNCAGCHVTGLDVEDHKWEDDGVQCEACHGPGSVHVELMDDIFEVESAEDREALNASINIGVDSQVCGQCHSQGTAPDGVHPYPIGYVPDGDLVLDEAFTLVATDDADFWYASGHASQQYMQYNEWLESGHANAYDNAAESEFFSLDCLVCHGESYRRALRLLDGEDADPELLPVPEVEAERIPVGVTCSSCHYPHQELPEEGDAPIDTEQVNYELCTSCHRSSNEMSVRHHPVQEMFEGQVIVDEIEPFVGVHFTEEQGPKCVTCHVPQVPTENGTRFSHALKPVLPEFTIDSVLQDSCTQCHTVAPAAMQLLVDNVQSSVRARHEAAENAITDESADWVQQTLDVIAGDGSWGIHNSDYVNKMLIAVEHELGLMPDVAPLELLQVPTLEAPLEQQVTEVNTPGEVVFGLTWPALVLVLIAFGIIGFSGWAFFFKGEE